VTGTLQVHVDRGGTFTDLIGVDDAGTAHVRKVLSNSDDAVGKGIEALLQDTQCELSAVRLGTTVATNALLTRRGVRTALVTTAGLGDLAWIGDQTRPSIFALNIQRMAPMHHCCIEARERLDVNGSVLESLDEGTLHANLLDAFRQGCRAVAICLLHGWRHDVHERSVRAIALDVGFAAGAIACSCDLPVEGFVPRLQTLVADAALTPIVQVSLAPLFDLLGDVPLMCMQSAGGLVEASRLRGAQAVLSGPAGGVVAAAGVARQVRCTRAVSLDMGGTSTDVAWWDGAHERQEETTIGGTTLAVSALRVETIAAGGGSMCTFDGVRLCVGPDSAGAQPGPACYGLGGPLTLTDCLVVLDRLPTPLLPRLFGATGEEEADFMASNEVLQLVHASMGAAQCALTSPEQLAQAFVDIAVESTAAAIRRISTQQGRSLSGAALVAFGGAGPLVGCAVADALNMDTVLVHPLAGVLSAWGIGCASTRIVRRATLNGNLDATDALACIDALAASLQARAAEDLASDAPFVEDIRIHVGVPDWDRSIVLPRSALDADDRGRGAFRAACRRRYGWDPLDVPTFIKAVEVELVVDPPTDVDATIRLRTDLGALGQGDWIDRAALHHGDEINGPRVIAQSGSTVFVEEGWSACVGNGDVLTLKRVVPKVMPEAQLDAAAEALFANRVLFIALEMGDLLQQTARSVNIRERKDYSCAIFTPMGDLIANGPHMPVHLGSMGASVKHVLEQRAGQLRPGDAIVLNDPFRGGTHLPDLTVVSPVFDAKASRLLAMVASRGHHSDIGGMTPGSMGPNATSLEQEGVVLDNLLLVSEGRLLEDDLRLALSQGPWPCRAPDRVVDDLRAQLAANQRGCNELATLERDLGLDAIAALMESLLEQGDALVRRRLQHMRGGRATMQLDCGGAIKVDVRTTAGRLQVDFTGTMAQVHSTINAPPAVTRAALLYVLRCLIDEPIALNDGCLRSVDLTLPAGSVLSPAQGAAVAGGNVETSQLVVDALLAAFDAQAASQGTMNNLAFGDDAVQHYETICGGTGAGPGFDGCSCVQGHMTNSRLTDPEVLERRFPVRLRQLKRRHGSGGDGVHRGGDGVVRVLELLEPLQVSLLSGRRLQAPPGRHGGGDGQPGAQRVEHADGTTQHLPACFVLDGEPGDRIVIETPGGGGWGAA
jgi:5-oxoprolinase (ATP-hydrolysing)